MKKIIILISGMILSLSLVACSTNTDIKKDDATNSSIDSSSATTQENEYENLQARVQEFIKSVNHDNYIIGYVKESFCSDDYSESYVVMDTIDGKVFKVEGLAWDKSYTINNFSLHDNRKLSNEPLEVGRSVAFFYDDYDELEDGTHFIDSPKEFLIMQAPDIESVNELSEKAEFIQLQSDILLENFNSLTDYKILSAEEAMQAVIKKFNLENMQKTTSPQGVLTYQNDNGDTLLFNRIFYNEFLDMSEEGRANHINDIESFGCVSHTYGDITNQAPYIFYEIIMENTNGMGGTLATYHVNINGSITLI